MYNKYWFIVLASYPVVYAGTVMENSIVQLDAPLNYEGDLIGIFYTNFENFDDKMDVHRWLQQNHLTINENKNVTYHIREVSGQLSDSVRP